MSENKLRRILWRRRYYYLFVAVSLAGPAFLGGLQQGYSLMQVMGTVILGTLFSLTLFGTPLAILDYLRTLRAERKRRYAEAFLAVTNEEYARAWLKHNHAPIQGTKYSSLPYAFYCYKCNQVNINLAALWVGAQQYCANDPQLRPEHAEPTFLYFFVQVDLHERLHPMFYDRRYHDDRVHAAIHRVEEAFFDVFMDRSKEENNRGLNA